MGNCASTYSFDRCVALVQEPLDADPGIVGPGVLGGFAATALLTFAAIILGYVTKSLPEDYLTDLDHKAVEKVASSWVGVTSVKAWKAFIRISRKCLFLRPPNEKDDLDEHQRREALKKFVLTLSDQQLVTGIAILVACFANWCRTSVYELNMVVSLAWFSSATHLATLDVLQDYFQHNRVVRNWRMIGMVAIVLLLIAGLLLTGFYNNGNDFSAPLPCLTYLNGAYLNDVMVYNCNGTVFITNTFLSNATSYDNSTFYNNGTYYANGSTYNNCIWYFKNNDSALDDGVFLFLGPIFTVAYLVYGYASALLHTFAMSNHTALTPLHISIYLILRVISARAKHITMEVINNAIIEYRAKRRANLNRKLAKLYKTTYGNKLLQFRSMCVTYSESFLSHIGGFFFALSYGLSKVATYRWAIDGPDLEAGSSRVDFGQVVPLVLLVLPLLAAAEIFHENDDKEVAEVSNKHATPASAAITHEELHGNHDSDNIASSNYEQAHVTLPDLPGLETIVSTPHGSHQPTVSHTGSAKSIQSSDVQFSRPIGLIFLCHIITSISVGILLNLQTAAVVAGPAIMSVSILTVLSTHCSEVLYAVRSLYLANRDNTLDRYLNDARSADKGTEMSVVSDEPATQNTTAPQPSSSADEASHGRDTEIETSVTNAAPENSRAVTEYNQGHELSAPPTTLQRPEVVDDADSENWTHSVFSKRLKRSSQESKNEAKLVYTQHMHNGGDADYGNRVKTGNEEVAYDYPDKNIDTHPPWYCQSSDVLQTHAVVLSFTAGRLAPGKG
ncbi:hypothetical protein MMC27_007383 [Xylographa pallens]|nr:hypothetical protein [Xylographa pallens]